MSVFSCFPRREKMVKKACEIYMSFYEKLDYLSKEIYDASINKFINVSLDNFFNQKKLIYIVGQKNFLLT